MMEKVKEYLLSPSFWVSIVVLILSVIIWKVARVFLQKIVKASEEKRGQKVNLRVLVTAIKGAYVLVVVAVILQINGINIGTLFAGLGIAGIIVGFALQDILKDLMMGMGIMWDKFFAEGDCVCYNGMEGKVVEFNAKVTKIQPYFDEAIITISNRNITEITKATRLVSLLIPAPYEVPLSHIRKAMAEITRRAMELPSVETAEFLGTEEFADSAINYKLLLKCVDPTMKGSARRGTLDIVQEVFAEENISIPYPQMDVHLNK